MTDSEQACHLIYRRTEIIAVALLGRGHPLGIVAAALLFGALHKGTSDLDLDTDYNWQSKTQYQLSETPDTVQPAYGIWNASVGLISDKSGWATRVLVKNIANTHYASYLSHGDLAGVVRWVPRDDTRYVGLNVHKDF